MAHLVTVDSAGTGAWHAGEEMDERSRRTMVHAGYDVPPHCAKQFVAGDFAGRDVVVALDTGHYNALWWLATETPDVTEARAKLVMLRAFDPELLEGERQDVIDPYNGGRVGFADVLAQVERSCAALLEAIERAVTSGAALRAPADLAQQEDKPPL